MSEQLKQIIKEYDEAHYECPVDRRMRWREAEARAQEAQAAQEQQASANLKAWVEHRIGQWFTYYLGCKEYEKLGGTGIYTGALGEVLVEERRDRQREFKAANEEERRAE